MSKRVKFLELRRTERTLDFLGAFWGGLRLLQGSLSS